MRRAIAAGAFVALLTSAGGARAQSKEDVARADALFDAAKALTDAGQYADACAKFAESERLAPGLGVTLYLADCYERIGRTASAWTEFLSAEGLARQRNDKRAAVAHARAQALEPKLERLTIVLGPAVPRVGLQVLRDGVPVAQEELGLAVPVDPGDHTVIVSSSGRTKTVNAHVGPDSPSATVRIDSLGDGGSATASNEGTTPAAPPPTSTSTLAPTPAPAPAPMPAPMPAPPTPAPVAPPPPRADASSDSGATRRWLGLGLGGAGVVGVALGAVFGLTAKSKLDQSNGGLSTGLCDKSSDHCGPQGQQLRKDAEGAATVSTIAFIAGGAAVAAGAVLYLTAPRGPTSTGIVVAPSPMAGGGGALLRGSF